MPPDSHVGLSERLSTFQVPSGTTYAILFQQLSVSWDDIRSVEGTPAGVETSYVMDRVWDHISCQYLSKLHPLFPREKYASSLPYAFIAELKEGLKSSLPSRI